MSSVILGWLLRRALEIGGIVGFVATTFMSLKPEDQAVILSILTGDWKSIPFGQIAALLLTIWGYVASFRKTVQPSVVTKVDGKVIEVAEKDLPATTKEAVKTSAPVAAEKKSAGKTFFEHLGWFK